MPDNQEFIVLCCTSSTFRGIFDIHNISETGSVSTFKCKEEILLGRVH
jgi:hypothetical protein